MNKQVLVSMMGAMLCLNGCGGLRYAATEAQKENARLHERVCATAADLAQDEAASEALCGLTALAQRQSEAFVLDYGLPENSLTPSPLRGTPPWQGESFGPFAGGELEGVLAQAKVDAAKRPDMWTLADNALELGIALAGLLGGIYGVRAAEYLKTAREKSKALKEIIAGNELFKQLYPEQAQRFKEAQAKQSPATQQFVTEAKAGSM